VGDAMQLWLGGAAKTPLSGLPSEAVLTDLLTLRREYLELKRQRRAGPEARLAHQQQIKTDVQANLQWTERGGGPELIVRDLARIDHYPRPDDRPWGISPWFKVVAQGLYYNGLEVILSVQDVCIEGDVATHAPASEASNRQRVSVVGRIPFDAIVRVDWRGDEYYPFPHVYCWFDQADGPYEALVLYELSNPDRARLLEGVHYKPPKRSRLRQWRDHRELQRAQREFERDAAELSSQSR
jgi:hypothetical protein